MADFDETFYFVVVGSGGGLQGRMLQASLKAGWDIRIHSGVSELIDLAAPRSLLRGMEGLGLVEKGYRHAAATTIYGGSSEVMRSIVAERRLGMPRSRG